MNLEPQQRHYCLFSTMIWQQQLNNMIVINQDIIVLTYHN